MKFLIDNQLPPKLAQWLTSQGHSGIHVQDVDMADRRDIDILEFAVRNGMVLVSKDEDFFHLALSMPGKARVVWVRLGNCRIRPLLSAFTKALPILVAAIQSGQAVIEMR